jgi:hypothetical protein
MKDRTAAIWAAGSLSAALKVRSNPFSGEKAVFIDSVFAERQPLSDPVWAKPTLIGVPPDPLSALAAADAGALAAVEAAALAAADAGVVAAAEPLDDELPLLLPPHAVSARASVATPATIIFVRLISTTLVLLSTSSCERRDGLVSGCSGEPGRQAGRVAACRYVSANIFERARLR